MQRLVCKDDEATQRRVQWLCEHQQHPGAAQILQKMLAWDDLLDPGLKHTKDERRKLATEQGISLPDSLRSKQFEGDFQQHICRHFSEDVDWLRSSMAMFAQRSSDHAATGHAASSTAGEPVASADAQEASGATEHAADQPPRRSSEPRAKQSKHTAGAPKQADTRAGDSNQESGAPEHAQRAARGGAVDATSAIPAQARVADMSEAAERKRSALTQRFGRAPQERTSGASEQAKARTARDCQEVVAPEASSA